MLKYALVTGSTKGIGRQIGIDLLKRGHFVIFNYAHSDAHAEILYKDSEYISRNRIIIKADLSTLKGAVDLIEGMRNVTSSLDYIVFNVGMTDRNSFENIIVDEWNKVINANLTVPFFLLQSLNFNIEDNGRIIFIGSMLGNVPHSISISYGVSKAGLNMLAKCLVKYFAPRKITVNVVAPGFVETEWQKSKDVEHKKEIENKIALKRFAIPEEISQTCMHLIDNQYINGQVIVVDGGYDYC
jgi:3-oxoacyl-[acyl-carrier protein] reductase